MTQVTAPFDKVLNLIKSEIENPTVDMAVVDELARIARENLELAAESKWTGNDTMNQMEAFGFGIFFNKKLVRQGYLDKKRFHGSHKSSRTGKWVDTARPDPKRGKTGRVEAFHAVQGHEPESNGYEVYFVNAMYYSAAHENWGLKIISQIILHAIVDIEQAFDIEVSFDGIDIYDWY